MKNHLELVKEFIQGGGIIVPHKTLKQNDWDFILDQIKGEQDELKDAEKDQDAIEILDAYCDIAYFACSITETIKGCTGDLAKNIRPILKKHYEYAKKEANKIADFEGAFMEVHRTNMSKYQKDEKQALIGAGVYRANGIKNAKHEKVGNNWVVFAMQNGWKRILKPNGWKQPQLIQFLKKA